MSFGSIWSITQRPSGVACSPFGCLPGVFQSTRGSTFEAMVTSYRRPPFWHSPGRLRTGAAGPGLAASAQLAVALAGQAQVAEEGLAHALARVGWLDE